jgi:hypothetical protein
MRERKAIQRKSGKGEIEPTLNNLLLLSNLILPGTQKCFQKICLKLFVKIKNCVQTVYLCGVLSHTTKV